jgi:hypothetical protein
VVCTRSPARSAPNPNDWIVGAQAAAPPPIGEDVAASLRREGEIVDFLSSVFGQYPFSASGGIVDDVEFGFALENQTRPVYSPVFWTIPGQGDIVVAHELAHQWYGDSLALAAWKHIWLNEGFATYAEWLWSEHEGQATVQESFEGLYNAIPEDDPFWSVVIGDPTTRVPVRLRGLRARRDDAPATAARRWRRRLLRNSARWAKSRAGRNVTTGQFIALAERCRAGSRRALRYVALHAG